MYLPIGKGMKLPQTEVIEFGADQKKSDINSGKIAYKAWSSGLDIVGGGDPGQPRVVKIYDNLQVSNISNDTITSSTKIATKDALVTGTLNVANLQTVDGKPFALRSDIPAPQDLSTFVKKTDLSTLTTPGWFGLYQIQMYKQPNANTCLDVSQFSATGKGAAVCDVNNKNQQFYYNPMTGQLKNATSGKCLEFSNNAFHFNNTCSDSENQQLFKFEHLLKWKNGDCVDVGNNLRHSSCDSNNGNQTMKWNYIPS
jgi:hypothetical protein